MNKSPQYNTPVNQGRSMVYTLLSRLFAKELDHQLLQELTTTEAQAFLSYLETNPLFTENILTLKSFINQLNTETALLELAADYCGLFLVGTKHSTSPYAGLYLNNNIVGQSEVLLFGEQHQKMQSYLQHSQLMVRSEFPEPADHIAVILAYAAHQTCISNNKNQLVFISQYLNTWLPTFTDKVTALDTGKFYTAVCNLTQTWVASDCEGLAAHS